MDWAERRRMEDVLGLVHGQSAFVHGCRLYRSRENGRDQRRDTSDWCPAGQRNAGDLYWWVTRNSGCLGSVECLYLVADGSRYVDERGDARYQSLSVVESGINHVGLWVDGSAVRCIWHDR